MKSPIGQEVQWDVDYGSPSLLGTFDAVKEGQSPPWDFKREILRTLRNAILLFLAEEKRQLSVSCPNSPPHQNGSYVSLRHEAKFAKKPEVSHTYR